MGNLCINNYESWNRFSSLFKSKLFVLTTVLLAFSGSSYGQLIILNSEMRMVEIGSLQANGFANITISDTTKCSKVAIELKDELNDSLVLIHEFQFDQNNGLPVGMSWIRSGNDIEIALGTFSAQTIWKVRIRLKDFSNNWTSWNEFIFN